MAKKAIVIGGQTASGKTSFSIQMCKKYDGEIISADSMQVYKGMDIGTAKPTESELSQVRHRLIDILDITEKFSSADFVSLASVALDEISSAGKMPFITGGTGLYSEMLFNSFSLGESGGDKAVRDRLFAEAEQKGAEYLFEKLEKIDSEAAAKTHPNNIRRVIRYLEIYYSTGKTPTEMNKINNSGERTYEPLYICFYSSDREVIYNRINARVDMMFEMGLEKEVFDLYQRGLEQTPTASAAIGYKEFFPYFRNERSIDEVRELIKQYSRNYAKRQQTYFKRINNCIMADISEDGECRAKELIEKYLSE